MDVIFRISKEFLHMLVRERQAMSGFKYFIPPLLHGSDAE